MKRPAVLLVPALLVAIAWSVVVRVPLIVNAPAHLDSDLAVDGLTLREAVDGHWRWHYPGTPYMGTGAVLLSYPPAKLWGASPETLVVGGTVAYVLLVAGVFATAWAGFGPRVAGWSLLPLAFASTGTLWLTGRITGGHMLAASWSAGAWLILAWLIQWGGRGRALLLGLWCGLGMWHDSMFLMTLVGLIPAGLLAAFVGREGRSGRTTAVCGLLLLVGFAIGVSPRPVGRAIEPHDAYNEQFAWSLDPALLREHARILFLDCLPRLVAGHRLPGLEADPDPALLGGGAPVQRTGGRTADFGWVAVVATGLSSVLFLVAMGMVAGRIGLAGTVAGRAIALGLLASSAAILAAFVVNRNIFNADNYRYLVLLLIPWTLGLGLTLDALARRSTGGLAAALGIAFAFGLAFTWDAAAWYRRLGWIDERGAVVRRAVDDPALRWLDEHPEVDAFAAGYWDAYRLAFLSGRPLRGVPHPIYPNRFPEWTSAAAGGRPTILIARPTPEDQRFLQQALGDGGRVLHRERGTTIASRPHAAQAD
ncbi:hypothetical protein [Planctomyces sp. SH-PL62]|uniref:hypothetical protein n=1 Tax=Planctomyces sp. SH-PL62 TaxID=1636152 RepID=UPI00078C6743|nr:hypothetical protein [Planctomyces sp. SH-PL62]AMV37081.1 hypothetical protein VT85_06595 [Planctomyces sp. SH-PL62]